MKSADTGTDAVDKKTELKRYEVEWRNCYPLS